MANCYEIVVQLADGIVHFFRILRYVRQGSFSRAVSDGNTPSKMGNLWGNLSKKNVINLLKINRLITQNVELEAL